MNYEEVYSTLETTEQARREEFHFLKKERRFKGPPQAAHTATGDSRGTSSKGGRFRGNRGGGVTCMRCGKKNHKAFQCRTPFEECKPPKRDDFSRNAASQDSVQGFMVATDVSENALRATMSRASPSQDSKERNDMSQAHANGSSDSKFEDMLWTLDSGASSHISHQLDAFTDVQSIPAMQITVANGHKIVVKWSGTMHLRIHLPKGRTYNAMLRDVLYSPEFSYNLLSVPKLATSGFTTTFDAETARINKGNKFQFQATKQGSLFVLQSTPYNTSLTELTFGDRCLV